MLGKLRKWCLREEGSAAIEFALVGVPFFMMLIGTVELSLYFATGVVLEGAANDAARLIRTGQVQNSNNPLKTFEDELCDKVNTIINCLNLQYEVVPIPQNNFANASALTPTFDADGDLVSKGFTPGGASDDVLVRVVFRYDFLTPFMGSIITGNPASNTSTLMSTVIIKNEPYKFGS